MPSETRSPFFLLLGKSKWDYWAEVESSFGSALSQQDYNCLLEFENRDLGIRELKNQCMSLFREELDRHPDLLPIERNPEKAILSFLEEKREKLEDTFKVARGDSNGGMRTLCIDGQNIYVAVDAWINPIIDGLEIQFLRHLAEDLRRNGGTSPSFHQLVEDYFEP